MYSEIIFIFHSEYFGEIYKLVYFVLCVEWYISCSQWWNCISLELGQSFYDYMEVKISFFLLFDYTEVDYAHTLRKRIVPIIIDVDFVPDGWLKEMIENVQSFDFSRRSMFAGSLDALLEHVKAVCSPSLQANGEVTLNIESTNIFFGGFVHWNCKFTNNPSNALKWLIWFNFYFGIFLFIRG